MSAAFGRSTGTVVAFDDHRGVGRVAADGTGDEWFFHCTRIIGSRTIPEGTPVAFEVAPGPMGLEAVAVDRLS